MQTLTGAQVAAPALVQPLDQPPGTLPAFAKDVPAAERFLGSKPAPAATPKGENICGPGTAVGPCTPTLNKAEAALEP